MGRKKEQVIDLEAFQRQVSNRNVRDSINSPASETENNLVFKINELIKKLEIILHKAENLKTPEKCIRICLQELTGTELFQRAEALLYLETENCLLEIAEPEEYIIPPEVNPVRYELVERARIAEEVCLLNNGLEETGVITIPISCFEEFFGVIYLYLNSKELPISCPSFKLGIKYLGNLLGNYIKFHKINKKQIDFFHTDS